MNLFSERKGLKPTRVKMQIDSMDDALRNGLWNCLTISYWIRVHQDYYPTSEESDDRALAELVQAIWQDYFKSPIDTVPGYWHDVLDTMRKYYYAAKRNEVYDFVEFVANNDPFDADGALIPHSLQFTKVCNGFLERELSGYRFVGRRIVEVTGKEEIAEIEQALQGPLPTVRAHFETALALMSDRKSPDYRNSIKESISAVEAICRSITGEPNTTLGKALDKVERKVGLSPALKGALDKLYGYTSGADGIRHALLEETELDSADAKFMLVSCSAFVNYLISMSSKAGLKLT
jgi:hypothetical protein